MTKYVRCAHNPRLHGAEDQVRLYRHMGRAAGLGLEEDHALTMPLSLPRSRRSAAGQYRQWRSRPIRLGSSNDLLYRGHTAEPMKLSRPMPFPQYTQPLPSPLDK